MIKLWIASLIAAVLVAPAMAAKKGTDPFDLPERKAYYSCLVEQVNKYAPVEGSPLELGIIGANNCNPQRFAWYQAILKVQSRAYAKAFLKAAENDAPKTIAAKIIEARGQ